MSNKHSQYAERVSSPDLPEPMPPLEADRTLFNALVAVLWSYRIALRNGTLIFAVIIGLLLVAAFFVVPVERFGVLQFRVLFGGGDRGKYPNETPFTSAEIVATPVLTRVFEANELHRHMSFPDFKSALVVFESNAEVDMLSFEYEAKLSDSRLNPVDRARLEEEYRKKRESLRAADFSLNFRRIERLKKMPATLIKKVLDDTLAEWARQAREQKGAFKYDIPVLSRNILQRDSLADQDYIVAVDILRTKVGKVLDNLDQIAELPGAALIRTDKTGMSLADIRSNLEDLLRFDIEPSISLITSSRLARNPEQARIYVQDQLRQIVLARAASLQRMKAIQEPLRDYVAQSAGRQVSPAGGGQSGGAQAPLNTPVLIPQLGESFLQQIVDMSTQNNDARYRQALTDRVIEEGLQVAANEREKAYYEALNSSLSGWVRSPETADSRELDVRLDKAFQMVSRSLDEVAELYEELSARNLSPGTVLYSVTAPAAEHVERSVSVRTLAAFAAAAFLFSLVMLALGAIAHHYYATELAARSGQTSAAPVRDHEIA